MILGVTDAGAQARIGMLKRIAVRSDMTNWRMPYQLTDAVTLGNRVRHQRRHRGVSKMTGSRIIAGILLVLSLVTVVWLTALLIRRAWCERYPYLLPRWLAVARSPMGDNLIYAALERLRDTPPRGHDRVLRRGEMIEAFLDERHARSDTHKTATGVRLGDAGPRP